MGESGPARAGAAERDIYATRAELGLALVVRAAPHQTPRGKPSEIFPVDLRATSHGISAAAGKLGAFVGVFLFPFTMKARGLGGAELVAAAVSLLGAIVTLLLLPEPKGKSLEQLTGDNRPSSLPTPA